MNAAQVETLDIYVSCFPIYAVVERLTRGVPDLKLHMLIQPQDGCLRSYELSDWDAALLLQADAIILGGEGFESFAGLVRGAGENGPAIVELFADMDRRIVRGINTTDGTSHWADANSFVYMSADGIEELARRAAESLSILDPRYRESYMQNLSGLTDELSAYKARLSTPGESVIVMNEAFICLADDLGLKTALCWERESGEALYDEALKNCIDRLSESDCHTILIEYQCPAAFRNALERAGFDVVLLDTLSTGRAEEGFDGLLARLNANADAIEKAFDMKKEETAK